jgi:hypothetical protein
MDRKRLATLLAFAAIAENIKVTCTLTDPEAYENKDSFEEAKKEERYLKKGLKKFYYKNGVVWALNKKNADRKAKKIGLYR